MDPVGIIDSQVAATLLRVKGPPYFYGQYIRTGVFYLFGNIQLNDPERSDDLCRIGDQYPVEPNVGLVIDAMQLEHYVFTVLGRRQFKLTPEPPGLIQFWIG